MFMQDLLTRQPALAACAGDIEAMSHALTRCFREDGKLLVCGNGGSAADAEHLAGELMKRYLQPRPLPEALKARIRALVPARALAQRLCEKLEGALPVLPLVSHSALMTAISNDTAADMVFAQQVVGYGRAGDALLCISTSGESANVLLAAWTARAMGLRVVALTGRTGGQLAGAADIAVKVPQEQTALVQEAHLAIYHFLSGVLEATFFGAAGTGPGGVPGPPG